MYFKILTRTGKNQTPGPRFVHLIMRMKEFAFDAQVQGEAEDRHGVDVERNQKAKHVGCAHNADGTDIERTLKTTLQNKLDSNDPRTAKTIGSCLWPLILSALSIIETLASKARSFK